MGLMGAAGMTSAGFAQPVIGGLLDKYKDHPTEALRVFAILPVALVVVFGIILLSDLAKGGYKAVRLHGDERGATSEEEVAGAETQDA